MTLPRNILQSLIQKNDITFAHTYMSLYEKNVLSFDTALIKN
jgi:hypothetical protein